MWQAAMWLFMLSIVFFICLRLWKDAGGAVKSKKICFLIEAKQNKRIIKPVKNKEALTVFLYALLFRTAVYFISVIILALQNNGIGSFQDFLEGWRRWDGSNYLAIAENGYADSLVDGKPLFLVFFPFYSYLIRIFHLLIPDYMVSALAVSCISYGIGCVYFYKLTALDYGRDAARNSVIFLSVFPFAFFFGSMMSESTFFMLSAMVLYYARIHKWRRAGLVGIFACITRMHGILLLFPAFIEWAAYYKPLALIRKKRYDYLLKAVFTKAIWLPAMGLGILYYLWLNYDITGNPFQFMIYQKEHWSQGFCSFTHTLDYVFQLAFFQEKLESIQFCIWIPEALLFILGMLCVLYGLKSSRTSYAAYLLVYLLLNYSVTWLLSGGRYLSCALPMFLFAGCWAKKHKAGGFIVFSLSLALFILYLTGHIGWKEIM